MDLNKLKKHT